MRKKRIPQAPGLPVLGNAISIFGDIRAFLTQQYLELGPVFKVGAFGRTSIVLAGVEANNFVNRYGKNHLRSKELWMYLDQEIGVRRSIHSMDGPDHLRLRKVERRGYSRASGESRISEIVSIARRRIKQWPLNRRFSVWQAIAPIVTEQVGMVGASTSATEYVDDLRLYLQALLMSHVAHRRPKWVMKLPVYRRSFKRVKELYEKIIDSHEPSKRSGKQPDLVDDVIALHLADPEFMPERDLFASVLGPFVAGLDTVTSSCSFMLYALLKHPNLLNLMKAECDSLFADGDPTPDAVRNLDVIPRIAMETLRMYPVAPATMRTVISQFDFAGFRIQAGEHVLVATTVPHYLPEVFPNPEKFDIDRYKEHRNEHRQPGAFSPFGVGTHHCLGSMFAEWQIAITMATIIRHTTMELDPPDYTLRLAFKPNPMPEQAFSVRILDRHL